MLTTHLLHPQILSSLARAGHGSKILLSDGNYPHSTARGPNADLVFLNLSPGLLPVTDVLRVLLTSIPIEQAHVMDYARTGPHAMSAEPPVWTHFQSLLNLPLNKLDRPSFYHAAGSPEVCLTIATADQQIYANLLLTIGVVPPK